MEENQKILREVYTGWYRKIYIDLKSDGETLEVGAGGFFDDYFNGNTARERKVEGSNQAAAFLLFYRHKKNFSKNSGRIFFWSKKNFCLLYCILYPGDLKKNLVMADPISCAVHCLFGVPV